jgi:hypothetical protein
MTIVVITTGDLAGFEVAISLNDSKTGSLDRFREIDILAMVFGHGLYHLIMDYSYIGRLAPKMELKLSCIGLCIIESLVDVPICRL